MPKTRKPTIDTEVADDTGGEKKKTEVILIRVTPAEKAELQKGATKAMRTLSDFLRVLGLQASRKD